MFETFNCGVGIDVVGEDDKDFTEVLKEVSQKTNIKMFDLGVCEKYDGEGNKVELKTKYGNFSDY